MKLLCLLVLSFGLTGLLRADTEFFTKVYVVDPAFADLSGGKAPGAPPSDAAAATKSILEKAGITFAAGASAIYLADGSKLIVRNTSDQITRIEAYLATLKESGGKARP